MVLSRERQNEQRRQLLLTCALELFNTHGYSAVAVRDIITSSGVGTGTFYNYFSSKEEILQTLLEDFADQIISSISEYYQQTSDLRRRFIETKRLTMELFARNEALSEVYSRVGGISAPIDACLQQFEDRLLHFYARNIEYGIDRGAFRDVPVQPVAYSILAMEKYALYRWIVVKTISKEEMIATVASFQETLATGLLADPEDPDGAEGSVAVL